MNVSKINPLGYQAKTEQGNTYTKSNIAKSAGILSMAAVDIMASKSSNKVLNLLSLVNISKDIDKILNVKVPSKLKLIITALAVGFDLLVGFEIGKWIDNKINKKRAQKADATTEETKSIA